MTAPIAIPKVRIDANVDRALGPGRLAESLHAGMDYKCTDCRRTGQLGTGPWVRIRLDIFPTTGKYLVRFTHAGCRGGGLHIAEGEVPGPTPPPEVTSFAMPFASRARTALGMPGPWVPAIVVEMVHSAMLVKARTDQPVGLQADRDGDVELVAAGVAALGAVPVSRVNVMPPLDRRWRVTLPGPAGGDGGIHARDPSGDDVTIFEPLASLSFPPHWNHMCHDDDGGPPRCAVFLAARIGLTANVKAHRDDFDRWLAGVALDGRLMGVSAPVFMHRDDVAWDRTVRAARDVARAAEMDAAADDRRPDG